MKLNPSQSHYVLSLWMSQGKIRAGQIRKALQSRDQEIRMLREKLAALEQLSPSSSPSRGRSRRGRGGRRTAVRRRTRRALSPKVRALRRQQGKYMGYVRRLKPAEKARVRAVREKQGMNAAIKLAQSLTKS